MGAVKSHAELTRVSQRRRTLASTRPVWSTGDPLVRFARGQPNKFDGVGYVLGEYGVPLIEGAAAHFECRIVDRYYGGDHEIFLGRVERYAYEHKPTLLFCHGAYHRTQPLDES